MKSIALFFFLSLLGLFQALAQESEYVPFVREGVKWVYRIYNDGGFYPTDPYVPEGRTYMKLEFKGDTTINGKIYKAMHKYHGESIDLEHDTIPIYMREENKVVYGIVPDGRFYADCPIGIWDDNALFEQMFSGEEFILYDFNDPVTFCNTRLKTDSLLYTDVISIGKNKAKRYVFSYIGDFSIVEGIGYSGYSSYTLRLWWTPEITMKMRLPNRESYQEAMFSLSYVIEDGEIIYNPSGNQPTPDPEPSDYEYLPLIREGVKWVNEKVIVNHGDTTRYYYNYEFSGKDSVYTDMMNNLHDACYYYLGNQLDVEQDSLIAGLRDRYKGFVTCMRNHAYEKVRSEGRQMFDLGLFTDGGSRQLYDFRSNMMNIFYYLMCEFYWCYYGGYDEEVTEENLVEVEPVMIDGVECDRIAYLDENGDPLAYIIEGIGFDSRDMGDLLTPFSRRPDPNADYQEWCGLSHVVKDGQIIYKGMRYRHGAFTGIDEVVSEQSRRVWDSNYYNLMGQPMGKELPSTPGIYIHQGKKICVR